MVSARTADTKNGLSTDTKNVFCSSGAGNQEGGWARGGGWRVHVTAAGVAFGENERVSEIDRESQGCGA
jgi:hypothetical protein